MQLTTNNNPNGVFQEISAFDTYEEAVSLVKDGSQVFCSHGGHQFWFVSFYKEKLHGKTGWGKPCAWDGKNFFFFEPK